MAIRSFLKDKLVHTAVGVAAVLLLTGANGEGCGGGEETTQPPEPACPPGSHAELVCDHDCGEVPVDDGMGQYNETDPQQPEPQPEPVPVPGECYTMCVPDSICPEGTYEETVCQGGGYEGDPGGMGEEPQSLCLDPEGCEEPEPPPYWEECYTTCVPINNCGPGEIEEWVCETSMEEGVCLDPEGCPQPPEECYPVCVPEEDWCGPYGEVVEVCDEWGCWQECYPTMEEQPDEPPPEPEPSE